MINTWNFEIYILLDTEGINKFIEKSQTEENDEEYSREYIKEISIRIAKQIYAYKASLRKYFIINGYPKKLN